MIGISCKYKNEFNYFLASCQPVHFLYWYGLGDSIELKGTETIYWIDEKKLMQLGRPLVMVRKIEIDEEDNNLRQHTVHHKFSLPVFIDIGYPEVN